VAGSRTSFVERQAHRTRRDFQYARYESGVFVLARRKLFNSVLSVHRTTADVKQEDIVQSVVCVGPEGLTKLAVSILPVTGDAFKFSTSSRSLGDRRRGPRRPRA